METVTEYVFLASIELHFLHASIKMLKGAALGN
jgi:hypothetical protein